MKRAWRSLGLAFLFWASVWAFGLWMAIPVQAIGTPRQFQVIDPAIVQVCDTCRYTTITAALAGISTNSSTNRIQILVGPGDYDEAFSMKSYVSLVGVDRLTTRVRGVAPGASITIPADVTGVEISHITVGGQFPIQFALGGTIKTTFKISDSIIGIVDASQNSNSGTSVDGLLSSTGQQHHIEAMGNVFYSTYDCIRMGLNDTYVGSGNVFILDDSYSASTTNARVWSQSTGPGAQMIETGFTVLGSIAGDVPFTAADITAITGTATQPGILRLTGGTIDMRMTHATSSEAMKCFSLALINANTSISNFDVTGVRCRLESTSANRPLTGASVTLDSDHANWRMRLIGGGVELIGGTSRTDIGDAETNASFVLLASGWEHGGTYSGSGTPTLRNCPVTSTGAIRTSGIATAPATCSIGDVYVDTSGAYCSCSAANTWTNMNGVGTCV